MVTYRGDQYIHLKIRIPKKVTNRQRELLLEFEKEDAESGTGGTGDKEGMGSALESAWKRVKEFLGTDDSSAQNDQKKKA